MLEQGHNIGVYTQASASVYNPLLLAVVSPGRTAPRSSVRLLHGSEEADPVPTRLPVQYLVRALVQRVGADIQCVCVCVCVCA